jgi:hypothetical protein
MATYKGLEPKTEATMARIVNSVDKAIRWRNIEKLTKQAYNYLYLCQGFIAHYDYYGFKAYYTDTATLKADILQNHESNKWRNFRPGDKDYEYYHNKALLYDAIVNAIKPDEWPKHREPIGECA